MADGSDFDVPGAVTAAAQKYGVDPSLALGVVNAESGMNPNVPNSRAGAIGPMQLMPTTAQSLGVDPTNPAQNIDGGVRLLRQLSDRYGGDKKLIAAAYNAGPAKVDQYGGVPPYPETQNYVDKVESWAPASADVMADFEKTRRDASLAATPIPGSQLPPIPGTLAYPDAHFPASADVMADFEKNNAAVQAAEAAKNPTWGSMAKQAAGGIGDEINGLIGGAGPVPNDGQTPTGNDQNTTALADVISPSTAPTREAVSQVVSQAPQLPSVAPAQNAPERAVRFAASLAPSLLAGPEGDASALGQILYRGKNLLYPAATGFVAGEADKAVGGNPSEVSAAQALGSIPGAIAAVPSALRGLSDVATSMGRPFMANVSQKAREAQAGQVLANAAGPGYGSAVRDLANYAPRVPGSPATVGDVTGNLGLIDLSRGYATKGSADYAALTEGQATARDAALRSLSPNADPADLRNHIQGILDDLDSRTQTIVDNAHADAQDKASAIGGTQNPEDVGAAIRNSVKNANNESRTQYQALYQAVDPDGTLTGNMAAPRLAAKNIMGDTSKYASLSPAEERLFGQAQEFPDVMPFKDINQFKIEVNEAASKELEENGRTASYARLSALRSALADNMSNTIGDAIKQPGVGARIKDWDNARTGLDSEVQSGTGGGDQSASTVASGANGGAGGAALSESGGFGSPAGTQSVSAQISSDLKPIVLNGQTVGYSTPAGETISAAQAKAYQPIEKTGPPPPPSLSVQPTMTPANAAAQRAADSAYAEHAQTFNAKPVSPVLKTGGYAGQYVMPNGAVPQQFFKAGPTGFESMQALAKASPEALPAIQDYAASTLRDMALKPDGTIDPKGFSQWQARYGDAIRALPDDLQEKFSDAATAAQTVADAQVARKQILAMGQSGALGKVLGATSPDAVTNTVGQILGGRNATGDMQTLVNATANNPDAAEGLKQAVVDHILKTYVSNTEAGASGVNKISANSFQNFLKQSQPALATVLKPDELDRLNAIAEDIQQSQRTLNATKLAGQSNTVQDSPNARIFGSGKPSTLLDILGFSLGGAAGGMTHGWLGAGAGEILGTAATHYVQSLRLAGISKVDDLVKQAVFNPEVARALMQKVKGPQDLTPQSTVGQWLLKALIAPTSAAIAAKPQSKTPSALEGVQ